MGLFGKKSNPEEEEAKKADLFLAAARGNTKQLTSKLKKKKYAPEVNSKNAEGKTKLMLSSANGYIECVTGLLTSAARRPALGFVQYMWGSLCCSARGLAHSVTLACPVGALVDEMDNEGCTALFSACAFGHEPIAAVLVGRGARVNHQSKKGKFASPSTVSSFCFEQLGLPLGCRLAAATGSDSALVSVAGMSGSVRAA